MTRPAAQLKMQYYPTPPRVVELIASRIERPTPRGVRVLDPCAGKGEALAQLSQLLGDRPTYGVELNTGRAREAQERTTRTVGCSYTELRTPSNAFQVLLLNPPYDWEDGKRLEMLFLKHCNKKGWLQAGGLLLWIVPERIARSRDARAYLAAWFEDLAAFRFPQPEYEAFKQVVVFGVQRARRAEIDPWEIPEDLPVLAQGGRTYSLPNPKALRRFYFHSATPTAEDLEAMASRLGRDFPEISAGPVPLEARVRPLIPLRRGHLAMFLGAGMVNNAVLRRNGEQLLVKGRTVKTVDRVEQESDNGTKIIETERLVSQIATLDLGSGEMVVLQGEQNLKPFFEQWIEPLAEAVQERFRPLYQFEIPADLQAVFSRLSRDRPLPGRRESGLFPAQAHGAAAILERFRKSGSFAVLVGEMGVGKTTTALAVAAGLHARKQAAQGGPQPFLVVVMCPTHLTRKWKREAQEVWPGARAAVVGSAAQMAHFARRALAAPGVPHVAVVSKEMAKLGPGWEAAYTEKKARVLGGTELATNVKPPFRCPGCGGVLKDDAGRPFHDAARLRQVILDKEAAYRFLACPRCNRAISTNVSGIPLVASVLTLVEYRCPDCAEAIADGNGVPIRSPEYLERKPRRCANCGAALWQFIPRFEKDGNPRWPIADFLARRFHGKIDLFLSDEVHHNKAKDTDQGYAFGNLIRASRHTLALTGTIFGGTASSVFYLWHRMGDPQVQGRYGWDEENRWVEHYGVLETVYESKNGDDDYGHFTANRRERKRTREIPGVSPALVPVLLNSSIFMRLSDLGYKLPPYREIPVLLEMTDEQRQDYTQLDSVLQDAFREDWRLLSAWLQSTLARPNSCWRDERVTTPEGALIHFAPAMPEGAIYPKERWLIEHCMEQAERGRKVWIYLRQTGTRDIQPRVAGLLEGAGLRVRILRQSVNASQREVWVRRNAPHCDVVVSNPKLVETGLDLLPFPSIVFLEPDYSLYTLMQASRRSWRLGQTDPVEVTWLAYTDTMEHRAIALIGQKVGAASLVYGDEAAAALAEQAGASRSLLHELAQQVVQGAEVPDLSDLFAQANRTQGWLGERGQDGLLTLWTEGEAAPVEGEAVPRPAVTITVAPPPETTAQLSFFGVFEGEDTLTWVPVEAKKGKGGEGELSRA